MKSKSYVMQDVSRAYNKPLFSKIIKLVNYYIIESLLQGSTIKLPWGMGSLGLRKFTPVKEIIDNKIHTTLPIDWKTTLELWNTDSKSKELKTLIRFNSDTIYTLYYDKHQANYKNKFYYRFVFPRSIKIRLSKLINEGSIDAPLLNTK